jgi:hypothetical protein
MRPSFPPQSPPTPCVLCFARLPPEIRIPISRRIADCETDPTNHYNPSKKEINETIPFFLEPSLSSFLSRSYQMDPVLEGVCAEGG